MNPHLEIIEKERDDAVEALKQAVRIGQTLQARIDSALVLIEAEGRGDLVGSNLDELVKILRG